MSIVPIKYKLSLDLQQVNDIHRRAMENWETNYGYICICQYNNSDSRNTELYIAVAS